MNDFLRATLRRNIPTPPEDPLFRSAIELRKTIDQMDEIDFGEELKEKRVAQIEAIPGAPGSTWE